MGNKLLKYLPEEIQAYLEMQYITSVEQSEIDTINITAKQILDNIFIETADETGIARWERMIGIVPLASATLEERKFDILARYNEQIPYTMYALENLLALLCGENGYSLERDLKNHTIVTKVELTAKNKLASVRELLERVLPCNLMYVLELIYNQHLTLAKFTHAQLKQFTHSALRNEVLG